MLLLSKINLPIKESNNKLRLCGYCVAIKNRSRKFKTEYQLTYHLTHVHKDDLGIIEPVNVYRHSTIEREILDFD